MAGTGRYLLGRAPQRHALPRKPLPRDHTNRLLSFDRQYLLGKACNKHAVFEVVVTFQFWMPSTFAIPRLLVCVFTFLAMSLAGCVSASAATRHVVLLLDERAELPGLAKFTEEITNTLRSGSAEPIETGHEFPREF